MTRFIQVDRIVELLPLQRLTAIKNLSLAESYLQDHFPHFPVMPGVMMLEAMYQAGAWLVRASEDFGHSMIVLQEAKNVKFADFVQPGDQLVVNCEWASATPRTVVLKCQGTVGDRTAVKARLTLERYNLATERPELAPVDQNMVVKFRGQLERLLAPTLRSASAT